MGKSSLKGTTSEDKNVLVKGHLEANEKHEFTLTFKLENLETAQDDQNKTFSAKLKAEAKAVESELEG